MKFWTCLRCTECCKLAVQLTSREWLNLTGCFGSGIVDQGLIGFFLRKTVDDSCPFLHRSPVGWFCQLQRMAAKPLACKLWPFRVLTEPKYGAPDEASFDYLNHRFYVYVIPHCRGILWGRPTERLIKQTVPEFIALRMHYRLRQHFSTSHL